MAAHAMLSASGAKRWLACTPSAALEAQCPPSSSAYADEGTLAHKLGELILRKYYTVMKKSAYEADLAKIQADKLYAPEMLIHAQAYADFVKAVLDEARQTTADARLFLERRLDFSDFVPDGFGTGDAIIISDQVMDVIDLKYGKGVPVDAVGNPQTRLYGVGAVLEYQALYDIERVRMTIYQPRLDSISTEEMTVDALLTWAQAEVRPKAELAAAGEGQFNPGDHCRFCRAKALCPARAGVADALADFKELAPVLLSVDEIGELLPKVEILQAWAKDLQAYALKLAVTEGLKIPGYKLVEGRSNRVISDPEGLEKVLLPIHADIYVPKKLKGLTDLEKLIGKKQFTTLAAPFIIKPAGAPTLVPATDKRPEMQTIETALIDFADDEQSEND